MSDPPDNEEDVGDGLIPMAILRARYSEDEEEEEEEEERGGTSRRNSTTQAVVRSLNVRGDVVNFFVDGVCTPDFFCCC